MKILVFQTIRDDWVFIISASTFFFSGLFVTLWDFVAIQGMVYRFTPINIVGLVLFASGVSLRLVAKRTLGKYYSYGLRLSEKHELIKYGVYSRVRHPISLAMLVYSSAIPLIFSSLYGFLLMLGLIPCVLYRIRIEERMLVQKFGDEYRQYMKQTKKLIPFIY